MKNTIYTLHTPNQQMNSYVMTTADGKIIAIDGGWRHDYPRFVEFLRELTGKDVPHIDAWFLSHAHIDHIGVFVEYIENHITELTFGKVYYNFPSEQFLSPDRETHIHEFYTDLPKFADKICVVSTYDEYDVGEAHFKYLYTPDAAFRANITNNSSVVFKMTLGGKTALFLGDAGVEVGNKLLDMFMSSGELKSDYVQMAHHGQNGCDRSLYEAVMPTACIFNAPTWLWNNDAGQGYNTYIFKTIVVKGWMEELGVKEFYVTKDADVKIEL